MGWTTRGLVVAAALAVATCDGQFGAKLNVNDHWRRLDTNFAARSANRYHWRQLLNRKDSVPATPIAAAAAAKQPASIVAPREAKTLLNTFPFNAAIAGDDHGNHHGDHHGDHGDHHGDHSDHGDHGDHHGRQGDHHEPQPLSQGLSLPSFSPLPSRASRQGESDEVALDIGSIAAAGERCIDKVVMVEETEYDDVIECKHSYSQKCHTTYATDYEPQQEEECEENFKKRCFIEYKPSASDEQVQFCYTPLVRNCDLPGPVECTTEYRSECTTRYHEHDVEDDVADCQEVLEEKCEDVTQGYSTNQVCTKWPVNKCSLTRQNVKKYSPETECKKVPFELCGPSACPVQPGEQQCQQRTETIIQEVPEETCSLEPQRSCKQVTKLVPNLKPRENCLDIPKEVCVRRRTNPRKVAQPVVKKWCYTPTPESGLPSPPPPPPPRSPSNGIDGGPNRQGQGGDRTGEGGSESTPISCSPGRSAGHCPARRNDGICNLECNTAACGFDGDDCKPKPATTPPPNTYLPPKGY